VNPGTPTSLPSDAGEIRLGRGSYIVNTQLSEDGSRVLFSSDKTSIRGLPDGKELGEIERSGFNHVVRDPLCVAANSSVTLLAAGFSDGTIHLYDIRWPAKK
jgi:hypothetical protein